MSGVVEAVYIYDELNNPILEHTYRSRLPSASTILPLYLAHPAPRPSLIYLPNTSPPVTVFSIVHSNLLFLSPCDVDSEPLLVLEFLHRVIDVLEDFLGAPLLSPKLQASYDVVAQLLNEICDGGIVCNTEPNVLREHVDVPGWMGKLLGGVGLPGSSSPALASTNPLKQTLAANAAAASTALPWRRPGIRHTSNEIYVDIIESLSVTIAPSGRILSALVSGTVAFTAKVSGVPDLLLTLSTPAGQQAIPRKMELPVFHPCVRLARWRDRPGELSFVPPDGRFILAGYETDLLPVDPFLDKPPTHMEKLFLPAFVDIRKSLGQNAMDFEVRLTLNTNFPGVPAPFRQGTGRSGSGTSTPSFLGGSSSSGSSSAPVLDEVIVTVPIPKTVRNITEMRPSRGDATYSPGADFLEWHIPTKEAGSVSGTATLYCTVTGYWEDDEDEVDGGDEVEAEAEATSQANLLQGYYGTESYQQDPTTYASASYPATEKPKKKKKKPKSTTKTKKSKKSSSRLINVEGIESTEEGTGSGADADATSTATPPLSTSQPRAASSLIARGGVSPSPTPPPNSSAPSTKSLANQRKAQMKASLMPTSASVSFSVRGWLPSGIKVDSLVVDPRKSRGLGEGVRPYKGVKYLCVSRRGVERRL